MGVVCFCDTNIIEMTTTEQEYFEALEIEHGSMTYYASGYLEYKTTACIGSNFEGYDYELLYETELCDITISNLWYYDKETGDAVDVLNQYNYREVEEMAQKVIWFKYQ